MLEPRTTGEAIQIVRRALYELARKPDSNKHGATEVEIINHVRAAKKPAPVRDFKRVMKRLIEAGAAQSSVPWGVVDEHSVLEVRYQLTPKGDLEEELATRSWIAQMLDELRRPTFVAGVVLGIFSALLTQFVARLLFGP